MKQDERQVKQQQDEKARGSAHIGTTKHHIATASNVGGANDCCIAAAAAGDESVHAAPAHGSCRSPLPAKQREVRHLFRVCKSSQVKSSQVDRLPYVCLLFMYRLDLSMQTIGKSNSRAHGVDRHGPRGYCDVYLLSSSEG